MSIRDWTGDDFRTMLRSLYFRAGWKARNLDADQGRVYDLVDWRDRQVFVDWDWSDHHVTGYIDGRRVYDKPGDIPQVHEAMHAIEDELMQIANTESADA